MSVDIYLQFQKKILAWYALNKRDLPWRHTRNSYAIYISECMLQQTQVNRVIPKFNKWLIEFPTVYTLARATPKDVLILWSGLGYNRRAMMILETAKIIDTKFQGVFPQNEIKLRLLPGIGEYTARAVLCFGFNQQLAIIDTNVKKVIALNFFNGEIPEKSKLQEVATNLLPLNRAYEWNQALMDYASIVLKKEKIKLPKQSPFKDSDRFYRGEIIRILLYNSSLNRDDLAAKLSPLILKGRFEKIILSLIKDKMIFEDKNLLLKIIESQ